MRTTKVVTASIGRDAGKSFSLTEMPAADAEDWFLRAMALLGRAGSDVPADIFQHGPAGFTVLGIAAALAGLAKSPFSEVRPMLAEMFACVSLVGKDGQTLIKGPLLDTQIEEVATRLWLREEVLSLHLGFSFAARLSSLKGLVASMTQTTDLQTMPTSPAASAPSSPAA